MKTANSFL